MNHPPDVYKIDMHIIASTYTLCNFKNTHRHVIITTQVTSVIHLTYDTLHLKKKKTYDTRVSFGLFEL